MGIFSDPCPKCRARVKKGAKFCSKCGQAAPKGWTKCGRCGAEVGTASLICWNCGVELSTVAKPPIFSNRWARQPGDFAAVIHAPDLKGWLSKTLTIDPGTKAMVYQRGKYKGFLPPGNYTFGALPPLLSDYSAADSTTIVLTDPHDVTVDLEIGGLRTKDDLEATARVVALVNIKDPQRFFKSFVKSQTMISVGDIEEDLSLGIYGVLKAIANEQTLDGLYVTEELRRDIEAKLRRELGPSLDREGIELVHVRFVDFTGEAYEKIRAERGEATSLEARVATHKRVYEALASDKIAELKTEQDFERYARQAAHDNNLKGELMEQELDELKRLYRYKKEKADQEHDWERAIFEAHKEAEKRFIQTKSWSERMDVKLAALAKMKQARVDAARLEFGLEKEKAEHELAMLDKRLKTMAQATTAALLTIVDGDKAERLVELEKLRAKEKMSPEQILAMVAEASPEAAHALAEKYKAEGQVAAKQVASLEERIAELKELTEKDKDRNERVLKAALDSMAKVAQSRAAAGGETKIITPGR